MKYFVLIPFIFLALINPGPAFSQSMLSPKGYQLSKELESLFSVLDEAFMEDESKLRRIKVRTDEQIDAFLSRNSFEKEKGFVYRGMRLRINHLLQFLMKMAQMDGHDAINNRVDASPVPGHAMAYALWPFIQSEFPRTQFFSVLFKIDEVKGGFYHINPEIKGSLAVPSDAIDEIYILIPDPEVPRLIPIPFIKPSIKMTAVVLRILDHFLILASA